MQEVVRAALGHLFEGGGDCFGSLKACWHLSPVGTLESLMVPSQLSFNMISSGLGITP